MRVNFQTTAVEGGGRGSNVGVTPFPSERRQFILREAGDRSRYMRPSPLASCLAFRMPCDGLLHPRLLLCDEALRALPLLFDTNVFGLINCSPSCCNFQPERLQCAIKRGCYKW